MVVAAAVGKVVDLMAVCSPFKVRFVALGIAWQFSRHELQGLVTPDVSRCMLVL